MIPRPEMIADVLLRIFITPLTFLAVFIQTPSSAATSVHEAKAELASTFNNATEPERLLL
jgi:hypothetical protein